MVSRLTSIVGGFALLAVLVAGAAATSTGAPHQFTRRGQMLWHFEALLRDTFGNQPICASRAGNFVSGTCSPLARFRPYFYVFRDARDSRLRISSRTVDSLGRYNRPGPLQMRGRLIACDRRETRILWRFSHAEGFAVDCVIPP